MLTLEGTDDEEAEAVDGGEEVSVSLVDVFLELGVHTCIIPTFTLYRIIVSSSPFSIATHVNPSCPLSFFHSVCSFLRPRNPPK